MFKNYQIGFVLLLAILVGACKNEQPTNQPTATPAPAISKLDAHGCDPEQGLQWSVVRNSCISTFELGIHLEPVDSFTEKHLFAFLVFKSNEDDSQAEVFIPKQKDSFVFNKTQENGAVVWKNERMNLYLKDGLFTLKEGEGTVLYEGKLERR